MSGSFPSGVLLSPTSRGKYPPINRLYRQLPLGFPVLETERKRGLLPNASCTGWLIQQQPIHSQILDCFDEVVEIHRLHDVAIHPEVVA